MTTPKRKGTRRIVARCEAVSPNGDACTFVLNEVRSMEGEEEPQYKLHVEGGLLEWGDEYKMFLDLAEALSALRSYVSDVICGV